MSDYCELRVTATTRVRAVSTRDSANGGRSWGTKGPVRVRSLVDRNPGTGYCGAWKQGSLSTASAI